MSTWSEIEGLWRRLAERLRPGLDAARLHLRRIGLSAIRLPPYERLRLDRFLPGRLLSEVSNAAGRLPHPALAWAVLLVSVVVTGFAWDLTDSHMRARANERFQFGTADIETAIIRRMQSYEAMLRGGSAVFAAAPGFGREQWRDYVASLRLGEYFPGVLGLGFAKVIQPKDLPAHLAAMRKEGFTNYAVHPEGRRDAYAPIVYLEPFSGRNLRALGFDMFQDPVRRAAMTAARDSGVGAMSGKVMLVEKAEAEPRSGFLLYVPVYRRGASLDTAEKRRAALTGYVYSPFRAEDLMREIQVIPQEEIGFELFDGEEPSADALLYNSAGDGPLVSGDPAARPRMARLSTIRVAGRPWTIHFHSRPGFTAADPWQPLAVAAGGGAIGLLLFFILLRTGREQSRRVSLAHAMSRDRDRAGQAEREKVAQLAGILRNVVDGIVTFDEFGRVLSANPAAGRIFGYPPDDMAGQPVSMLMPDAAGTAPERSFQDKGESGRDGAVAYSGPVTGRRHDGEKFPMEMAVGAVPGDPAMFVCMVRDVTERLKTEHALEQAKAAAEAANRSKSELLAIMNHEIRTPLAGVIGMLDLLAEGDLPQPQRDEVRITQRSARSLLAVINDVLDFSELEAGKLSLDEQDFSVAALIAQSMEAIEPLAREKRLTLQTNICRAVPDWLRGDRTRLGQILLNLLSNAVKFTDRGEISVSADVFEDFVVFQVTDTGIGIAPADQERLFARRRDSSARHPGDTGLGLAISRQLVELMGGEIGCVSEPGRGALFWFRIPLREGAGTGSLPAGADRGPRSGGHLLLAEDSEINQLVAAGALTKAGFTVDTVENGRAAVKAIEAGNYDLVLMDAGMDGLEAAAAIRALPPPKSSIPIIAMTAFATEEDAERCIKAGMDDHIAKPFEGEALIGRVRRLIGAEIEGAGEPSLPPARPGTG